MPFEKQDVTTVLVAILTRLLSFYPFFSFTGFSAFPFSLGYALSPLVGFYGTSTQMVFLYGAQTMLSFYLHPMNLLSSITHLPTVCGALFLTMDSRLFKGGIAALCIALFLLHPVGYTCSYYVAYWIPPVIIGLLSRKSVVLQAVGSTMTTHAVGSVIWLYTHDTTSLFWATLFYRVWAERLLCVTALVAGYYLVVLSKKAQSALYERRRKTCVIG
ncbi:hypothetical protein H0W26_03505 [Candidatus Dependentiae bacterium]|nr:hypothetical protein [Candidatus Dependentiae bacterium]